jgi:predicted nucleic acid-binding Zn finger protein
MTNKYDDKNKEANKGKAAKATKTANRKKAAKKISYYVKPEKMTLEEWQVALRRQVAHEEKFVCKPVDDEMKPGEYTVENAKKQTYKVVYRGAKSPWNYCSCMDFKTSGLGTCKHLEALKMWLGSHKHYRVHRELPPYTSVYLSYTNNRQVRIRIGEEHREEYEALAGRYFDSDGAMTEKGFKDYAQLLMEGRKISDSFRFYDDAIDFIVEQRERRLREKMIANYTDADLDSLLSVSLYPYQREGVRFAFTTGKSIIADEMGLGKTIQAIATAELLRKERLVSSVLIVCPTSLKYQWKREIERFAHAEALVIEGGHLQRKVQYDKDVSYKIVSYNSMCNDVKILGSLQTDLLIMDEVQRLKNWNTQISQAARRISSNYSVVLSGTPLENRLEELYSVMEFADQWCLGPYYLFKDACIECDETGKVIGYKNLNRVGEQIRQRLIRRTKKGVALQMPKRQDKNLIVPMTKEQMGIHNECDFQVGILVKKWKDMHFLSETDHLRMLKLLSQMRMVCDSTYILDQKTRKDTKVDETMNILLDLFSQEDVDCKSPKTDAEKVVIFSQWERMTRLIAQELTERGIGFANLHGGVPSRQRADLIKNFWDDPNCRVFLSTDAGSTGLNLQVASTIINLDLPWNPAVLEQRIARIYRLGQQRPVQVINLVSAHTIEEDMIGKLRFKTAMFEGVLDGGEDCIFLGDKSRFEQMMESLSEAFDEDAAQPESEPETIDDEEMESATEPQPTQEDDMKEETEMNTASETPVTPSVTSEQRQATPKPANTPEELVTQGISFLSGLAQTLQSPEATDQLVNALVETDEKTGESTLRIPVPDKQTVTSLLSLVGKLFGRQ